MDALQPIKELIEKGKREAEQRRFRQRLRNVIPNTDPMNANAYTLAGKAIDVYGMVLNGIDIVTASNDAMTVLRTTHLLHESEMGLTTLKESGRIAQLANTMEVTNSVMSIERFLFAANVVGVLATYVGVWLSIAGAWAAAKADILTDNAKSGASRGAVLGANDAGPHYLTQNFWMQSEPSYPGFREAEKAAKNIYNISLAAGYAEGKSLTRNQKGNLFGFLHGKMTVADRGYYSGDWQNWAAHTKKDYYILCGALFRREVLR